MVLMDAVLQALQAEIQEKLGLPCDYCEGPDGDYLDLEICVCVLSLRNWCHFFFLDASPHIAVT